MSFKNGVLLVILVIALFFRLYRLESVPPGASLDEVSLGYNAYSLWKTGADEYGTKFPILLRAYDDWRPALYAYLIIPFEWIFGLSVLAVRLPSVLLGTFSILMTYLLAKELFKRESIALVAAFFLAISPWHIYISRLGHEVNLGAALALAGVYFYLHSLTTLSFLLFALSLYGYQSEKIVAPLWAISLFFLFRKKGVGKALMYGATVLLPILLVSFSPESLSRFRGTSVFAYHPAYLNTAYPRSIVTMQIFVDNLLKHFKPEWLFSGKLLEAHKAPFMGLFYWWDGIFMIVGTAYLYYKKLKKELFMTILFTLSSFLPAALTTQAPHAMRSFTAAPFMLILSAAGVVFLLKKSKILLLVIIVIIAFGIAGFWTKYFTLFPAYHSGSFQFAAHDAIQYAIGQENRFERIIISNEDQLYQSYMFYLFRKKINPREYQVSGGTGSGGYNQTHRIGNVFFRPVDWEKDKALRSTLLVGNRDDFPPDVSRIHESRLLDGAPSVVVVSL